MGPLGRKRLEIWIVEKSSKNRQRRNTETFLCLLIVVKSTSARGRCKPGEKKILVILNAPFTRILLKLEHYQQGSEDSRKTFSRGWKSHWGRQLVDPIIDPKIFPTEGQSNDGDQSELDRYHWVWVVEGDRGGDKVNSTHSRWDSEGGPMESLGSQSALCRWPIEKREGGWKDRWKAVVAWFASEEFDSLFHKTFLTLVPSISSFTSPGKSLTMAQRPTSCK